MGMAWAEKLPSGGYRGGYRDPDGKKRYVTDQGRAYRRKSDAKEAAEEAAVKARRSTSVSQGTQAAKMPWGQLWEVYVDRKQKKGKITDQLKIERDRVERYVMPKWGNVPLNKIKHDAAQDWVDDDLVPGHAPTYVRLIWYSFAASMRFAVKKKILDASPCVGIDLPPIPETAQKYLTVETLATLKGHLHKRYQRLLEFQFETGLRPEELIAMHADQIDGGWLTVSNVYIESHKVIRPYTKGGGIRQVPLTRRAQELVAESLGDRDLTIGCGIPHAGGKPCRSVIVFPAPRAHFATPRAYKLTLWKASARAGLESMSPYTARRGFATHAADRGVHPFVIQAIMGHKKLSQTSDYVQRSDASRRQFLAAMGDPTPLTAVGQASGRGADRGAEVARTTLDDPGSTGTETAP
jgi:integrase